MKFKLQAPYEPQGDQPRAIGQLVKGLQKGYDRQTLLGVTGSGKTFTMAHVIEAAQRPTLVLAPNKALAAQLANEFRELFAENAVEYFVSYYDYYQPEAYVPQTDTYIEKDSSINDEIDRLRHSATSALLSRRDVIIVASVSCIYGLGSPEDYQELTVPIGLGETHDLPALMRRLVDIQYQRNDISTERGTFRLRGDALEVYPAYEETAVRIGFFGDEVEDIVRIDPLTGEVLERPKKAIIYPATHFVTLKSKLERAISLIEIELAERLAELDKEGKLLEAQRLRMRTNYDLEMLRQVGYCHGIENYSRHISGRGPGDPPYTLLDYFPDDFLTIIDESHVAVPQLRGMYHGDRSRKETLIAHGFRLPSALDNRPLSFDEFGRRIGQGIFLSATPSPYELEVSKQVVEQLIRPTGLIDPEVLVRPTRGQIEDLITEIRKRTKRDERVLVTTLTKKMAEDLADYLFEMGIRVRYLHSDIETTQRIELLTDLRLGRYDVLVGINLLREGLDLPEVSLVSILDADKEGFLRDERSLIQTIGRAARNVSGQVIMYADQMTDSMRRAIGETSRRREVQMDYNREHGIEPKTVRKVVSDILQAVRVAEEPAAYHPSLKLTELEKMEPDAAWSLVHNVEEEMHLAATELNFEYAAQLRDEAGRLRDLLEKAGFGTKARGKAPRRAAAGGSKVIRLAAERARRR